MPHRQRLRERVTKINRCQTKGSTKTGREGGLVVYELPSTCKRGKSKQVSERETERESKRSECNVRFCERKCLYLLFNKSLPSIVPFREHHKGISQANVVGSIISHKPTTYPWPTSTYLQKWYEKYQQNRYILKLFLSTSSLILLKFFPKLLSFLTIPLF